MVCDYRWLCGIPSTRSLELSRNPFSPNNENELACIYYNNCLPTNLAMFGVDTNYLNVHLCTQAWR